METIQWKIALNAANNAKRCGAKTRQPSEALCQSPAMTNGRCRMHGGKSPGASKGKNHGRYTYGLYTSEAKNRRRHVRELIGSTRSLLCRID